MCPVAVSRPPHGRLRPKGRHKAPLRGRFGLGQTGRIFTVGQGPVTPGEVGGSGCLNRPRAAAECRNLGWRAIDTNRQIAASGPAASNGPRGAHETTDRPTIIIITTEPRGIPPPPPLLRSLRNLRNTGQVLHGSSAGRLGGPASTCNTGASLPGTQNMFFLRYLRRWL